MLQKLTALPYSLSTKTITMRGGVMDFMLTWGCEFLLFTPLFSLLPLSVGFCYQWEEGCFWLAVGLLFTSWKNTVAFFGYCVDNWSRVWGSTRWGFETPRIARVSPTYHSFAHFSENSRTPILFCHLANLGFYGGRVLWCNLNHFLIWGDAPPFFSPHLSHHILFNYVVNLILWLF